jgi:hypothetical protein
MGGLQPVPSLQYTRPRELARLAVLFNSHAGVYKSATSDLNGHTFPCDSLNEPVYQKKVERLSTLVEMLREENLDIRAL